MLRRNFPQAAPFGCEWRGHVWEAGGYRWSCMSSPTQPLTVEFVADDIKCSGTFCLRAATQVVEIHQADYQGWSTGEVNAHILGRLEQAAVHLKYSADESEKAWKTYWDHYLGRPVLEEPQNATS